MLSPGKWHEKIPREPIQNLKFRRAVLLACRGEKVKQRAMVEMCKRDIVAFINLFGFQYNPILKSESLGPFITWPFQDRALLDRPDGIIWCYERDRTAVIEKSRDMGASWLFLFVEAWLAAFHNGVQVLNISRSADAVDSKSKNSLFAKLRFINKHLPRWLTGEITEMSNYVNYGRTDGEIAGEASTGRAGAGGRGSVVFVDEFSIIKEDQRVRQNTASIAECRFFNGTHLDVGTEFYQLTQTPEIVKIQMHWTRHPRKNQNLYSWDIEHGRPIYWKYDEVTDLIEEIAGPPPGFPEDYPFDKTGKPDGGPHPGIRSPWYDKKVVEIGDDRRAAMELDINPTGAASQFYNGLVIRRCMTKCRDPEWQGRIKVSQDTGRPMGLEVHGEGPLSFWFQPGLSTEGKLLRVPSSTYVLGADLGTGRGATPSCITIFDCKIGAKVGRYSSLWEDPKEMARIAVGLAYLFSTSEGEPAYLAWETPGPGLDFGSEVLKELVFRNIYWRTDEFRDDVVVSDIPGWNASPSNKNKLHSDYRSALSTGEFVNWDEPALKECLSYVHANGSVEHPKARKIGDESGKGQNHGDHVVADALAWLMARKRGGRVVKEEIVETALLPNSIANRIALRQRQASESDIWA